MSTYTLRQLRIRASNKPMFHWLAFSDARAYCLAEMGEELDDCDCTQTECAEDYAETHGIRFDVLGNRVQAIQAARA